MSELRRMLAINAEFLRRLNELRPVLEEEPSLAPRGSLRESELIRLALQCGLEALERRYAKQVERRGGDTAQD
jgi:hypothetical protein